MEEERVVMTFTRTGKATAEFILKSLVVLAVKVGGFVVYSQQSRIHVGETDWNKFMNSLDKLAIEELQATEVNLNKLKDELNKYSIGFAFHEQSNGTTLMAYSYKHQAVVEKSLADTIGHIMQNVEDFKHNVKKNDTNKTVAEKLNYYKKEETKQKETKAKKQSSGEKVVMNADTIKQDVLANKIKGEKSL